MFAFPFNSPSLSSQAILYYETVNTSELVNDLFAFHLSKILRLNTCITILLLILKNK